MIVLSVLLHITQVTAQETAQEEGVQYGHRFFNVENSILDGYEKNEVFTADPLAEMPTTSQSTGIIETLVAKITDMFATVRGWLFTAGKGLKSLVGITTAVPLFLSTLPIPLYLIFSLSALWYLIAFLLLINWVTNK